MKTRDIVLTALFSALMAVCSWISIPTAVPFTMQTFAVFVSFVILGGKRSMLALLVYIFSGALGAPVFASFSGGAGVLLGSTGGYIVGFIASIGVMWLSEKLFGKSTFVLAASMAVGLCACYALGTAWFMLVYVRANGAVALATVLSWCVAPFIAPDLIKLALAILVGLRVRKTIMR